MPRVSCHESYMASAKVGQETWEKFWGLELTASSDWISETVRRCQTELRSFRKRVVCKSTGSDKRRSLTAGRAEQKPHGAVRAGVNMGIYPRGVAWWETTIEYDSWWDCGRGATKPRWSSEQHIRVREFKGCQVQQRSAGTSSGAATVKWQSRAAGRYLNGNEVYGKRCERHGVRRDSSRTMGETTLR